LLNEGDLIFVLYSSNIFAMEKARENGIMVIAASIIAVIRLRGEPIKRSPKVVFIFRVTAMRQRSRSLTLRVRDGWGWGDRDSSQRSF